MSRFAVKAVTPGGEVRHVTLEAISANDAAMAMLAEGLTPVSIRPIGAGLLDALRRPIALAGRSSVDDVGLFCEQLAAMSASGLTVEHSLRVVARQSTTRPSTRLAQRLLPRVQGGMALSAALETESALPSYVSGMVRAAERGGRLADGLADAGRYLQRQAETRGRLVSALAYPVVVLITVLVALVLVLTVVVPSFEPLFSGEEHRLPAITRAVLWLSYVSVEHTLAAFTIAAAASLAVAASLWRFPALRHRVQDLLDRLPPVRLAHRLDASRVVGVMGMLFRSGVEVSEAVAMSARAAGSARLRISLETAARQLREGMTVPTALRGVASLPEDTCALIEVGEHTGELGAITLRAAHLLEVDTSQQLNRLVAMAGPIAIAVLGLVVGVVVGGVMLGVLSINQLTVRP